MFRITEVHDITRTAIRCLSSSQCVIKSAGRSESEVSQCLSVCLSRLVFYGPCCGSEQLIICHLDLSTADVVFLLPSTSAKKWVRNWCYQLSIVSHMVVYYEAMSPTKQRLRLAELTRQSIVNIHHIVKIDLLLRHWPALLTQYLRMQFTVRPLPLLNKKRLRQID